MNVGWLFLHFVWIQVKSEKDYVVAAGLKKLTRSAAIRWTVDPFVDILERDMFGHFDVRPNRNLFGRTPPPHRPPQTIYCTYILYPKV